MTFVRNEQPSAVTENIVLAQQKLGLYNPTDILAELRKIGRVNSVTSWNGLSSPEETVAYFLGQEIACHTWGVSGTISPASPYRNFKKLHLPKELKRSGHRHTILLLGCTGKEQYLAEQKTLAEIGIPFTNHWTVDFSTLPIRRIKATIPAVIDFDSLGQEDQETLLYGQSSNKSSILLQRDASNLPFVDGSTDLVVSDLFFGFEDSEKEEQVLNEMARIIRPGGQLLTRASLMTNEEAWFRQRVLNSTGIHWRHMLDNLYGGKLPNPSWRLNITHSEWSKLAGRDPYIGLTIDQWLQFGRLYADFINKHYYGENRITEIEQFVELIQNHGYFEVKEVVEQEVFGINSSNPSKYLAVRAERLT